MRHHRNVYISYRVYENQVFHQHKTITTTGYHGFPFPTTTNTTATVYTTTAANYYHYHYQYSWINTSSISFRTFAYRSGC